MEKLAPQNADLGLFPPVISGIDDIFVACQDPEIQKWVTIPIPYLRRDAEEFATLHMEKT